MFNRWLLVAVSVMMLMAMAIDTTTVYKSSGKYKKSLYGRHFGSSESQSVGCSSFGVKMSLQAL